MEIYYCKKCNNKFESKGSKIEWIDSVFGPCSKLVANCSECGSECNEYNAPKQSGNKFQNHTPPCGSCCGGCGL